MQQDNSGASVAVQNKKTFNGWKAAAIILAVLLIGEAGAFAWYVTKNSYKKNKEDHPSTQESVDQKESQVTTKPTHAQHLAIEEWGVKFEIPNDLTNVRYVIDDNTIYFVAEPSDGSMHYIANVEDHIKDKAMAVLVRSTSSSQPIVSGTAYGKKLGDFYYYTYWSFSGLASGAGVQGSIYGLDTSSDYDEEHQILESKASEVFFSLNDMLKTIELKK